MSALAVIAVSSSVVVMGTLEPKTRRTTNRLNSVFMILDLSLMSIGLAVPRAAGASPAGSRRYSRRGSVRKAPKVTVGTTGPIHPGSTTDCRKRYRTLASVPQKGATEVRRLAAMGVSG